MAWSVWLIVLGGVLVKISCHKFGYNNGYTCHCLNNGICHQDNGKCTEGCSDGWYGPTCQKLNIAYQQTATQSQQDGNQGPELTIDGNRTNDGFYDCSTSSTGESESVWWFLDLDVTYTFRYLQIYSRSDKPSLPKGYKITVKDENTEPVVCYEHNGILPISPVSQIDCGQTLTGRYVNISSDNSFGTSEHFLGLCEVEIYVCSNGIYGEDCTKFCHCADYKQCNVKTGKCPKGACQVEWYGDNCNFGHKFGYNNGYTCHCSNNGICDQDTGKCTEGCSDGWHGPTCQKQNIAYQKTATQSTQFDYQGPGFTTDGNKTYYGLYDCSSTGESESVWWFLDLDFTYAFRYLQIYSRTDKQSLPNGYKITIEDEKTESVLCYQHDGISNISSVSQIDCGQTLTGRYINISSDNSSGPSVHFLGLCEVEIYVCSRGTYGKNCTEFCHCADYKLCDIVSGKCPDGGCHVGWQGDNCNFGCDAGHYDIRNGCNKLCSERNCKRCSSSCDSINGTCDEYGCKDGFEGIDCTLKIDERKELGSVPSGIIGSVIGLMIGVGIGFYTHILWTKRKQEPREQQHFYENVSKSKVEQTRKLGNEDSQLKKTNQDNVIQTNSTTEPTQNSTSRDSEALTSNQAGCATDHGNQPTSGCINFSENNSSPAVTYYNVEDKNVYEGFDDKSKDDDNSEYESLNA